MLKALSQGGSYVFTLYGFVLSGGIGAWCHHYCLVGKHNENELK
jgi:hypothetical protein